MTGSWSIAVMCHNEAATLEDVVRRTHAVARGLSRDFEIVIVDDGSRDGSGEIAARLAGELREVRVVSHGGQRGIGAVLRTAYSSAEKEWLTILPADGEFVPEELGVAFARRAPKTVVCYTVTNPPSLARQLVSWVQRMLNRVLFGLRVERVNWVKVLPAQVVRGYEIVSHSPIVETEVLVRLHRDGWTFVEVPSHNKLRGKRAGGMSAAMYLRAIAQSVLETLRLWRAIRRRS